MFSCFLYSEYLDVLLSWSPSAFCWKELLKWVWSYVLGALLHCACYLGSLCLSFLHADPLRNYTNLCFTCTHYRYQFPPGAHRGSFILWPLVLHHRSKSGPISFWSGATLQSTSTCYMHRSSSHCTDLPSPNIAILSPFSPFQTPFLSNPRRQVQRNLRCLLPHPVLWL